MEKMKMHSPNMTQENIARIREMFPGCVTEAKGEDDQIRLAVNFDQLRQELSDSIVEESKERYHLNWPGKRKALLTANAPIAKTLRPCREDSVNFDTTTNLFIEGDNLEVLKLIQESYLAKVKMIYIDPPYNTGNDFIYKDDFSTNTKEFLKKSNQLSEDGNRLVANTEANGRFHSDWLSMMYPRLKLARNLLRNDGTIFVSIGVEELSNLKMLMDEVFGEFNFIEVFSWVKTSTPPALSMKSRKTNEYILCYEKCRNSLRYRGEPLVGGDQPLLNTGNPTRKLVFPKDKVYFSFLENGELKSGKNHRVELVHDLQIEGGYATEDFALLGEFKWTQPFLNEEIKNGTSFVIKSDKLSIRFIRVGTGYKPPTNFIKEKYTNPIIDKKSCEVGTNEIASAELRELMGADVFSHPKPVSLIEYLLNFTVNENDIVMDFFAGSGTMAEAVYSFSAKKNINVRYILVQLPENLTTALAKSTNAKTKKTIQNAIDLLKQHDKPHILSELSKLRIRVAGENYKRNFLSGVNFQNYGFRTFKVDSSNLANVYYTPDTIKQDKLKTFTNNIKPNRKPEDLLFQVLLDWGMDISLPIRKEFIQDKAVFFVNQPPPPDTPHTILSPVSIRA